MSTSATFLVFLRQAGSGHPGRLRAFSWRLLVNFWDLLKLATLDVSRESKSEGRLRIKNTKSEGRILNWNRSFPAAPRPFSVPLEVCTRASASPGPCVQPVPVSAVRAAAFALSLLRLPRFLLVFPSAPRAAPGRQAVFATLGDAQFARRGHL